MTHRIPQRTRVVNGQRLAITSERHAFVVGLGKRPKRKGNARVREIAFSHNSEEIYTRLAMAGGIVATYRFLESAIDFMIANGLEIGDTLTDHQFAQLYDGGYLYTEGSGIVAEPGTFNRYELLGVTPVEPADPDGDDLDNLLGLVDEIDDQPDDDEDEPGAAGEGERSAHELRMDIAYNYTEMIVHLAWLQEVGNENSEDFEYNQQWFIGHYQAMIEAIRLAAEHSAFTGDLDG